MTSPDYDDLLDAEADDYIMALEDAERSGDPELQAMATRIMAMLAASARAKLTPPPPRG